VALDDVTVQCDTERTIAVLQMLHILSEEREADGRLPGRSRRGYGPIPIPRGPLPTGIGVPTNLIVVVSSTETVLLPLLAM
jgi:hypothetical protein